MRKLLLFVMLCPFAGCVTVPEQTALLSAKVSDKVAESRKDHQDLLDIYVEQTQRRIEERMQHYWIPRLIKKMLSKTNSEGKTFDETVCQEPGKMDRALAVQDFVEALNRVIARRRQRFQDPLTEEEQRLRGRLRDHYDLLERMTAGIVSNLQSVLKEQAFRDKMFKRAAEAINMPLDKIAPIKEAAKRLDGLLGEVGEEE